MHVWKRSTNITEVVESGYDCLLNVGYVADSWYLDNLDVTWAQAYASDPRASVPSHLQAKVLGGHGEMWGRNRRVVFNKTVEKRGSRYSRRRDGGRLGFRRDGLAAPRRDRGATMEQCGRRRRGAAAARGLPMLVARARRRRGAAQQLHGADGARRPGRLHAAAAANLEQDAIAANKKCVKVKSYYSY